MGCEVSSPMTAVVLVGADSPHGMTSLEVLVLFCERRKVYLQLHALVLGRRAWVVGRAST